MGLITNSAICAIVFIFVYTLWSQPHILTNGLQVVSDFINSQKIVLDEDNSTKSCLIQFNEEKRIYLAKQMIPAALDIQEHNKFVSESDAVAFLKKWKFLTGMSESSCFGLNGMNSTDIDIFLVKLHAETQYGQFQYIYPVICTDGMLLNNNPSINGGFLMQCL